MDQRKSERVLICFGAITFDKATWVKTWWWKIVFFCYKFFNIFVLRLAFDHGFSVALKCSIFLNADKQLGITRKKRNPMTKRRLKNREWVILCHNKTKQRSNWSESLCIGTLFCIFFESNQKYLKNVSFIVGDIPFDILGNHKW